MVAGPRVNDRFVLKVGNTSTCGFDDAFAGAHVPVFKAFPWVEVDVSLSVSYDTALVPRTTGAKDGGWSQYVQSFLRFG